MDISSERDLNVVFHDRRHDADDAAPVAHHAGSRTGWQLPRLVLRCGLLGPHDGDGGPSAATSIPAGAKDCLANEAGIIKQPTGW